MKTNKYFFGGRGAVKKKDIITTGPKPEIFSQQ